MKLSNSFLKKLLVVLCPATILFMVSCKKNLQKAALLSGTPNIELAASASAVTYNLVWSEEFDGTTVNPANWNF